MSWALEAIEKEALARAQRTLLRDSPTMFGLSAEQIMAFVRFFEENVGKPAVAHTPKEITEWLEALVEQ